MVKRELTLPIQPKTLRSEVGLSEESASGSEAECDAEPESELEPDI